MNQNFQNLLEAIESAKVEAESFFDKGVNAAGARLRKNLQTVQTEARVIRKQVQEAKKQAAAEKKAAKANKPTETVSAETASV